MSKQLAFIFPGQGCQFIGMGKDLFDQYDIAKERFTNLNDVMKRDVSGIIFNGNLEELTLTSILQPAIVTISSILYDIIKFYKKDLNIKYTLGHSVGEYSALYASGAISFCDMLLLVKERGLAMESCSNDTGMFAVLGSSIEELKEILIDDLFIANDNCPGQVILSGTFMAIDKFIEANKDNSKIKKCIKLKVSGAFHSPFMQEASEKMKNIILNANICDNKIPIVHNCNALPSNNVVEIKNYLSMQITSQVLWTDSIKYILKQSSDINFIECSPKSVLSAFINKIDPSAYCRNISTVSDVLTFINE